MLSPFLLYNRWRLGRRWGRMEERSSGPAARIRVRYAETDAMGVAYHANYLVWFESGRTEFCRLKGLPYREWEQAGVFLPAVEARCRYKHPARYDDLLDVLVDLSDLSPYTVTFSYRILRSEDGLLLAEGQTKHGFCDRNGKLLKAPEPFFGWLQKIIGQAREEGVVSVG